MTIMPSENPLVALTELSSAEQKSLGQKHPEMAQGSVMLLSSEDGEALEEFRDVTRLLSELPDTPSVRVVKNAIESIVQARDRASLQSIAEMIASVIAIRAKIHERLDETMAVPPDPAATEFHVTRNVQSRAAFIAEFNLYTADQLQAHFGLSAGTLSAMEREDRIFSIDYIQNRYFPAFEFDDKGKPNTAVTAVVQLFGKGGWETALWFASANGWLGGERPVDMLTRNPSAVIEAADQEVGVVA